MKKKDKEGERARGRNEKEKERAGEEIKSAMKAEEGIRVLY